MKKKRKAQGAWLLLKTNQAISEVKTECSFYKNSSNEQEHLGKYATQSTFLYDSNYREIIYIGDNLYRNKEDNLYRNKEDYLYRDNLFISLSHVSFFGIVNKLLIVIVRAMSRT